MHQPKLIYKCDFPGCEHTFSGQDLCKRHRDGHTGKESQLDALPETETGKPPLTFSYVGINQQRPPNTIYGEVFDRTSQVFGTGEGFDGTDQIAPPEKPPTVTATPWEPDETFITAHGVDEIRQIISNGLTWKRKWAEPSRHVSFNVHWQLVKFVSEQYEEMRGTSLASVIALTGSAVCAQATTVGDYLQRNWPKTCSLLLPLVEKAQNGDSPVEYRGKVATLQMVSAARILVLIYLRFRCRSNSDSLRPRTSHF